MHAVIRIDEVEKEGVKFTATDGSKVTPFNACTYRPSVRSNSRRSMERAEHAGPASG